MDALLQLESCPTPPPRGRATGGPTPRRRHCVEVKDPKTKQTLRVWSNFPLQAFILDDGMGSQTEGEKVPDAVIVGEAPSGSFVLFVDLTMSMRPRKKKGADAPTDPCDHKFAQLLDGIRHFHPVGRSGGNRVHGDDHHDAWSRQEDLPVISIGAAHRVGGLGIGFHHAARVLPKQEWMGGKLVRRAVWSPVRSGRGEAEVTLEQIFRNLGWEEWPRDVSDE